MYQQVLAGGNKEALSVALAAGLQFIRVEGFVFSHVADEGFTDATAGSLLRYRANIRADNILIFTDIKKKHRQVTVTVKLHVSSPKLCNSFW
jgi:predicted TIM-barrel enzyme